MKISIITVCFNSANTIADTINSVNSQSYKSIEHIFVDGGSTDQTVKILKKNPNKKKKIFIKKKSSIYEAMNYGIKKSKGEIIHILNSDDIFQSNMIIEKIMKIISKHPKHNIFLGNVIFFNKNNYSKVKRYYSSNIKKILNLKYGDMPPHPGSFVRKKIYDNYGLYNPNYKIASDFDFFYKNLFIKKLKYKILKNNIIRMRTGGASNKHIISYLKTSKEICDSIKYHRKTVNYFSVYLRGFLKLKEIFFFQQKKLNSDFELFKFKFLKEKYHKKSFKILKNLKYLNLNKNFILSGMNLAFLGYFSKKILYPHKNLIHWPDGIFTKKIIDIEKIPGREIIQNLKINNNIKQIKVIGNISTISKKYLIKKFNTNVCNISLPYAPIEKLKKKKININKNELVFITLPTPKQEELAYSLAEKNSNFKIICIGGSIAIASGEEKPVPKLLQNYEFLWRLNNDFLRRSIRLFESFFYYIKGHYKKDLYNKTIFKIIE